jgi:hypothetical protein
LNYNYIEIDRSTASPDLTEQLAGDTTKGENRVFLQGNYGSLVRVEMPDILNFVKMAEGKNIVINQACLVMKTQSNGSFTPAPAIWIGNRKTTDTTAVLVDLLDATSYIDGVYNTSKSEYRFYITRHIQELLRSADPEKNIQLTLFSSSNAQFSSTRNIDITTIYGPAKAHGDNRMRLEVVYTILP